MKSQLEVLEHYYSTDIGLDSAFLKAVRKDMVLPDPNNTNFDTLSAEYEKEEVLKSTCN
jgi:hypothetical protein